MSDTQSTTPWRCEVEWHTHLDNQRGQTCRPDSARHPDLLRTPADDFRVGDIVHLDDGQTVEIRDILRGDKGQLTVNQGSADQLDGRVWEQATVSRSA